MASRARGEKPNEAWVRRKLDEALAIYPDQFLSDEAEEACRQAISQGLHSQTFLIKANPEASDAAIKTSLLYRYPVYYGKPIFDAFDKGKTEKLLEYSMGGVKLVPQARYGICGPLATTRVDLGPLWALHVWGINLETTKTDDFRAWSAKGFDLGWYRARCTELYRSVFRAAAEVVERTGRLVEIRMPLISQGQFLKAAGDMADACREIHYEEMGKNWGKLAANGVSWTICDFGDQIPAEWRKQLEVQARTRIDRDLFDVRPAKHVTLLVNAWDPMSFVGNGGLGDRTIDGFLVAGFGPGAKVPNSAYLHNPFLSTGLHDPANWVG